MIHDIAHCTGLGCSLRETCHRYKAHLEAQKLCIPYLTYLVIEKTGKECGGYWEDCGELIKNGEAGKV